MLTNTWSSGFSEAPGGWTLHALFPHGISVWSCKAYRKLFLSPWSQLSLGPSQWRRRPWPRSPTSWGLGTCRHFSVRFCLEFKPVYSHVTLRPQPVYVPKVPTTHFRDLPQRIISICGISRWVSPCDQSPLVIDSAGFWVLRQNADSLLAGMHACVMLLTWTSLANNECSDVEPGSLHCLYNVNSVGEWQGRDYYCIDCFFFFNHKVTPPWFII